MSTAALPTDELSRLRLTVDTLEAQRSVLGDAAVDLALGPLLARLTELSRMTTPSQVEKGIRATPNQTDANRSTVADTESEHKVVTVVFADVSGFTAMSERMSPEDVRDIMNGLFEQLVPAVERYGGVIDKFIGDEIMAVFGAPRATEHHVDHALRACLAMFSELAAFNEHHDLALGLHIGVNSGKVVAGGVGSSRRQDYSVMGDAVNIAARLEDAGESGDIFVGPAVYRAAAGSFDFEALPPITLKGKSQPLPVYRLLSAKARRAPPTEELAVGFEGRENELAELLEAIRHGTNAVTIVGQPGLGKSRLVSEIRRELGPSWPWFETAAMAHRSGASYAMMHDLFDEVLGFPPGADAEKIGQALTDHAAALGLESDLAPYLRRFRDLNPVDGDASVLDGLPPKVLRQRLHRAVARFLASTTIGTRVLVCVEDLHWADPSSIALLTDIVASNLVTGATFLVTTRSDASRSEPWLGGLPGRAHKQVQLGPLSARAVGALLERALVTPTTNSPLRAALLDRSDGNPFYIVSFLRSLLDNGTAVLDAGQARLLSEPKTLELPDSLQAVVAERIDRLDVAAKAVLQLASVVGRRFSFGQLNSLATAASSPVDISAFDALAERHLIESAGVGHAQFVHAVVQDVVYQGMLGRERRRLHSALARILASEVMGANADGLDARGSVPPNTAGTNHAVIAWHLEQADETLEASIRYEQASEQAQASYAHLDALAHVEKALDLSAPGDDARQQQLHERAGDLLYLSGRFVEASERFSTAADASHDLVAARRHRKWAHTLVASQQIPAANERIALPQTILRAISPESRSEQWWREYFATEVEWLWLLYLQSRTDEMRSAAARLATDLAAHGTRSESGRYHRSLALLELRAADFRADTEIVRLAATAHAELADDADRTAACFAGFTHAFTVLWSGDDKTAGRLLRNVLEEARRIGDGERHLLCLTYLAVTARFGGDVDGTRAFATAGAVAAHTAGAQLYEGVNEANLAWADWRAGHDTADRTQQRLAQAAAHIRVVPGYPFLWLATLVEIALLVDAGDLTTVGELCASLLMPPMQRLPDSLAGPLARAAASPSPESRRAVVAAAETTGHL